jgi:predicted ATPase
MWTSEFIGYSIRPARSIGQVRLMLREGDARAEYNLADVGYGLSQILPVMAQIWLSTRRRRAARAEFRIVAIEQPELHLHPAFQTCIADALVGALAAAGEARNYSLSLVVETHSEALINRLGELIAAGRIPQDTVGIYLFEKEAPNEVSTVRMSEFDRDGVLENWPFGFFSSRVPLPRESVNDI